MLYLGLNQTKKYNQLLSELFFYAPLTYSYICQYFELKLLKTLTIMSFKVKSNILIEYVIAQTKWSMTYTYLE